MLSPTAARLAFLAVLFAGAAPAAADDEASEHTAQLIGASADTLGVSLRHDERTGWSMEYRRAPGATAQQLALPFLPADHAHYQVVVGPGRHSLTFVLASRAEITTATPAIWVWKATATGGGVARQWTIGDLLTAAQLASVKRSISHVWWQDAQPRLDGARVVLAAGGRTFVVDPARGTLTRR